MATTYTSLIGLALPVTGELSGSWGNMVDNAITSPLDVAIAGTQSMTGDSNVTLTVTNGTDIATNLAQVGAGTTGSAQYATLLCSGARTAIRTITAPAQSKIYTIINATTGGFAVKLVGAGPTTGLTIPNGATAVVAWNGSDFIEVGASSVGNRTINGTLSVTGTSSFTGPATFAAQPTLSSLTASQAVFTNASKGLVSVALTGTGNVVMSDSPTLTGNAIAATLSLTSLTSGRVPYAGTAGLMQDSTNLTFNGTLLTTNALTVTNAVTVSNGTVNGLAYLNASKILTASTAIVFDGQNLGVGATSFGTSASKVLGLGNATAPTTSPVGMGQIYVEAGALKYRGSSGTVTTVAPA